MIKSCIQFIKFLNFNQKKNLLVLQLSILINSLFEIVGISLIVPFIGLLAVPKKFFDNEIINSLYLFFEFQNQNDFIISLGVAIILFLIISTSISIFVTWRLNYFCNETGYSIGTSLFHYYISEDVLFHNDRQTSNLINNITIESNRLTHGVLYNILVFNSKLATAVPIIIILFLYNFEISVIAFVLFGVVYLLLFKIFQKRLYHFGRTLSKENEKRFNLISETLNGLREIKIYNQIEKYKKDFFLSSNLLARTQALSNAIFLIPRNVLEFFTFSFVILISLYLFVYEKQIVVETLPLLTIFAVAGLKLIPIMQMIYISISNLKAHISAYENLKKDLLNSKTFAKKNTFKYKNYKSNMNKKEKIQFDKALHLKNISFSYPANNNKKNLILKNVNLEVKKNSIIGIVGRSGCGKSTLLDLITGFIQAQTGTIKIDNIELKSNNSLDWQKKISFVSQRNFFLNKSILSNITINKAPVKTHNLKKVIKLTDLQTVFKTFNHGINTQIGEFGSKLSGGQRQRIAIARAVYKESDIVIFDEATNALDFASEKKIINNLSKFNKTFIIVSHRVNSLKNCDIIYFLKNGMINDQGTYLDLFKRNNDFRNFVEMSSIKKT
jgi:HlyD family secretion protein